MADFDLTQTDQQVQNILNDGQSAMGAGAQTTLTTEYVMLKDTSGVYHKILKSSFTEAIRDVLAGLLVNNDKGTTINQIAAIASGDFGSITPANLASVLGTMRGIGMPNNTDMNTIIETGIYYNASGTIINGGRNFSVWIVFGVQIWDDVHPVFQINLDPRANTYNDIMWRTTWKPTKGWTPWQSVNVTPVG